MTYNRNLKVNNLKEVFKNKSIRNKYVFTYEGNGSCYYSMNNEKISVKKFNEIFPIEFKKISPKGDNPDKRKNWFDGNKSY